MTRLENLLLIINWALQRHIKVMASLDLRYMICLAVVFLPVGWLYIMELSRLKAVAECKRTQRVSYDGRSCKVVSAESRFLLMKSKTKTKNDRFKS